MHTVILGNGIIAMTIAFRLARQAGPEDRITVVGKKTREGAATFAAPAMLNSFAEIEKDSLTSDIDKYRFDLSIEATKKWPQFEQEIYKIAYPGEFLEATYSGFDSGTYVINNTAADDLDDENFDSIVEGLKAYNEPYSAVSPTEIPNYMPEQRHRATRAIYIESEGWVNPRRLMNALEKAMENLGIVTFVDGEIIELNAGASGIATVTLSDACRIDGDQFILATGASVSEILTRSKLELQIPKVFYGVGISLEIKSPEFRHTKCVRTPNRGLACGLYTAPYAVSDGYPNDHVIVGASNFISPTPYHHGRLSSVAGLMQGAIEQINANFYKSDLIRINLGWRPTSQDTYPLIGRTSITNLVIVTGTKREGFHLSPVISEKIVTLLYGGSLESEFEFFKPERKLIQSLSREVAIDKAVRHQMSAAYQHGFSPSKSRMPEQIKTMYRENLERLHDQVGAVDWGIPPEMLDMYRYGHALA